jgi:hypothetical protein
MKNTLYTVTLGGLLSVVSITESISQTHQKIDESTLNKLISTKVTMDKEGVFKDRYTIQLYFGDREKASATQNKYEALNLSWKCDLYWESPNLAVRVGQFRNRLEADRALMKVKEDFPNAIVMKP